MNQRNPKDFFKKTPELLELDSVQELISYARDLEYEVYDKKIDSDKSKEEDMRQLLTDIKISLSQSVTEDQNDSVDYHHMLLNLKKYFFSYIREHKLNL